MPGLDFFRRYGVFGISQFLTPEECARFCAAAQKASSRPSTVTRPGQQDDVVDEGVRRSAEALVSPELLQPVTDALKALQAPLARHFNLSLESCDDPQVLRYRPGDYFHPHSDSSRKQDSAEYVRNRMVTVVTLLNEHSNPPGAGYGGGALTLYGVVPDQAWAGFGFDLVAGPGDLVAFRSTLVHCVQPVTHGERFSLVTWFY